MPLTILSRFNKNLSESYSSNRIVNFIRIAFTVFSLPIDIVFHNPSNYVSIICNFVDGESLFDAIQNKSLTFGINNDFPINPNHQLTLLSNFATTISCLNLIGFIYGDVNHGNLIIDKNGQI
jgi:hypothetical protein